MEKNNITDNEIVGVLARSKKINLVVEGPDESAIFRKIEDIIEGVELIICEGCGTL
jgi:phosphotransferase system HPr-like phosphotransfer protein